MNETIVGFWVTLAMVAACVFWLGYFIGRTVEHRRKMRLLERLGQELARGPR